ncbi:hypothetical protein EDC94DRAFT_596681 [Helicostylum pulchrum]|nr:hypothetical protein EDC94DRAFT_596681 [Helicostylum pulchrum]
MSNNSARDYVESYVKEDDYLVQEQPRYDPTKPVSQPKTTPLEQEPEAESVQASEHYKVHLPTQNPIPSTNNITSDETSTTTEPQPQIQYSARDFKEQRNEIHETALTVCADLHESLFTCFKDGSWWDKAKMCEEQKQTFWKCYNTQKVFLKDVNYKGPVTTEQEDNRIMAEAYKLRKKLDQK